MLTMLRIVVVCLLLHSFGVLAEDVAEIREKGIRALKESETNPRAIVEAARNFAKAAELYARAGNDELATEMNSFLYWCKKKMTLQDIEQFTKGGEAVVAEKLDAVEKAAPKSDEAQKWYDRAEKYAKDNPNEHYLIAVRFFEVASRFIGSKESIAAQERSLKEQGLSVGKGAEVPNTAQPPKTATVAKVGKTINLLALIDPSKDAVAGKWGFSGALLVGEKAEAARIEIPYQPPEEYDFKIVFMRVDGDNNVCQVLYKSESQFIWMMDGVWKNTKSIVSGFETLDGKAANENETTLSGPLLTNRQWHISIVQVRNTGITVLLDGRPTAKLAAKYDKLTLHSYWKLRDSSVLGLAHQNNKTAFSTVELIEITGTGKKTR